MTKLINQSKPYSALSIIYDNLMDHVEYQKWSEYILTIISMYSSQVKSVIDLACGTGNLIKFLKQPNWNFYACDGSPEMINVLKNKFNTLSQLACAANILHIPLKDQKFDVALLIYDSINYISEMERLHHALQEIHRILKPGGLFIFDTVTPEHCQTYFNEEIEEYFANDLGYTRKSRYDSIKNLQHTEFIINAHNKTYYESHIQKIYTSQEMQKYVRAAKFDIVGIFHEFTLEKPKVGSERIHYVCRKL